MDLTQTTENLLQSLDELIETALMHQQPHGLILDSARSKIKDQHDCIARMWDALEQMRCERDEARELSKTYKEYAQLLTDEINDTAALAHVHGWRSRRFDQGKILREKIKQLEEKK